jgi:predicted nucleic acid-binding Zn ribbon protein
MSYCPECGEEVNEDEKYCSNCGSKLKDEYTKNKGSKLKQKIYGKPVLTLTAIVLLSIGSLALAFLPVVTVQIPDTTTVPDYQNYEVPLQYNIIDTGTNGIESSLNQQTGIGDTTVYMEVANEDNEGGYFKAKFECETESVTMNFGGGEKYIGPGETARFEYSSDNPFESCMYEVEPPTKTVKEESTQEQRVMRDKEISVVDYLMGWY